MKLKIYGQILIIIFAWSTPIRAGYQVMFTPRISIIPEYTDNLFLSAQEKTYDYITVISPGFTAQIAEKTGDAVSLSYDAGYSCYDSHPEFNTLRHNARLAGQFSFTKYLKTEIQNSFILTEESVTRLEEGDEDETEDVGSPEHITEKETIRRTREYHYTNDLSVAFTRQFGESDLFSLSYLNKILENKDPGIEDRITHNPSVSLTYWPVPDKLGFEAGMNYIRDEYSATPEEEGYWEESIRPSAGIDYWFIPERFGIRTTLSAVRGEYLNRSDRTKDWYESVEPGMALTYLYIPYQLEIEAGLSHIISRFSDPSDDFDKWNGNITLSKKFSKKFELRFRYAHTLMDFKGDGEDYAIYDPSVGVTYTIAEDTPLSLSVGYFVRDRTRAENEAALSVNGDLGKTWAFSRYGSVSFTTSSGYDEDYMGAEKLGFGIYYDANARAQYTFSETLSGQVFASYKRDKFKDLETTRDDETRELGWGLTFYNKWFTIRVDYTWRSVDSTQSENDYNENRLRWQVSLAPMRPMRVGE